MTINRYLKENRRQVTTWENVFATSTADQRMLPIMTTTHEEEKDKQPNRKQWPKHINTHFREVQKAKSLLWRCQLHEQSIKIQNEIPSWQNNIGNIKQYDPTSFRLWVHRIIRALLLENQIGKLTLGNSLALLSHEFIIYHQVISPPDGSFLCIHQKKHISLSVGRLGVLPGVQDHYEWKEIKGIRD